MRYFAEKYTGPEHERKGPPRKNHAADLQEIRLTSDGSGLLKENAQEKWGEYNKGHIPRGHGLCCIESSASRLSTGM
jgi:hypothetical protein